MQKHSQIKAFSLVELSIVLVILGLLIGGILSGQSLVRAAELRTTNVDIQKYRTAAMSFRDKYFYFAGDIPNATRFWGTMAGTGSDAACLDNWSAALRQTKSTCNGDGDGKIGIYGYTQYESYLFWRDLALSGLIEGFYNGRGASDPSTSQTGCIQDKVLGSTSCPVMRISGVSIMPAYQYSTGDTDFVPYPEDNYYFVGKTTVGGTPNGNPLGGFVTPTEAWNMDTKMDDGLPYSGSVQSNYRTGATQWGGQDANNCASSATIAGATYNFALTTAGCAFRIKFN